MAETPAAPGEGFPPQLKDQIDGIYDTVYVAINANRWTNGVEAAQSVLRLLEPYPLTADVPWPLHLEKAWSLFLLGMAAKARGERREAARLLEDAASIAPGMLSRSPTAAALEQLGMVLAELKQYEAAARELRGAIALYHNQPQDSAKLWLSLGRIYEDWRKRAEAIRAYHKALEVGHTRAVDDAHEWTHDAYAGIVRCVLREGHARRAEFWGPWIGAGRVGIAAFVVLTFGGLACMVMAAVSAARTEDGAAGLWMGMVGLLLIVLVLPSARRVSGPGFAFDLRAPSHDEIPKRRP